MVLKDINQLIDKKKIKIENDNLDKVILSEEQSNHGTIAKNGVGKKTDVKS